MRNEVQWLIDGRRYGKTFKTPEAAIACFENERVSARVTEVELIAPGDYRSKEYER